MTDVETRDTFGVLAHTMRDLRAAEEALRAEQDAAWKRYVARVDAVLAFDLQIDTVADDDDHDPSHLLDSMRSLVDELRARAQLGAMEGEELVGKVRAAVRRLSII